VRDDEKVLATEYPTTSSWMTAVGGTEFVDGNSPVVWFNQAKCSGGGGGSSSLIDRPEWQRFLDPAGADRGRLIPDLAALAGKPGYIVLEPPKGSRPAGWVADGGTSLATPAYAAGFALVRQALLDAGVAPPTLLNPEIYRIASSAAGSSIFTDVTVGTNDLYELRCCTAGVGFDLASGWGEVDFTALHAALGGAPLPPPSPGPSPVEPIGPRFTG
jgi:kumamolisin